jgi:hypothetical protein
MMIEDDSTPSGPAAKIALKVVPGSRASQIVGRLGDRLKVKVAAPPEDGKANRAVCDLLAEALAVGPRAISVVAGHSRPEKLVRIEGLCSNEVSARLGV